MKVELRPYAEGDLALTEALETNPDVMKELGGPRSREELARVHRIRAQPTAAGEHWWFVIVPRASDDGAGQIGIWQTDWEGAQIHEVGWMLLPDYHGRGIASRALEMLLDRVRESGRFEAIHAFPGVTNAPSNALCRKFGFELVEEREIEFSDRPLRVNHWVLVLARPSRPSSSSQPGTSPGGIG